MSDQEYLEYVAMEFRLERTRQRLTQRELAKRSGLNQQTVYKIEDGKESWHILTLKKVADALGKPLKDFL